MIIQRRKHRGRRFNAILSGNSIAAPFSKVRKNISVSRKPKDCLATIIKVAANLQWRPGVATTLIGIDWGTTQLRGFRMNDEGEVLERRENASGISAIQAGAFDAALRGLIADWQDAESSIPILMCGMIGSRQGWCEVPYIGCPARLSDFLGGWKWVDTSCGRAFTLGGLS